VLVLKSEFSISLNNKKCAQIVAGKMAKEKSDICLYVNHTLSIRCRARKNSCIEVEKMKM